MAVQLTVIGSSPAWPNPGGACSGYVVDGRLLLDCGPGVLAKLRERAPSPGNWPSIEAIAITHLHLDHWGDLIPWVWGRLFGPGKTRPALWLPPGSIEALRPILQRLGNEDMLDRAFDVSEYEPRRPFTVAGLDVTAVPVVHYNIDAYGFRVQDDRVLAYSGDTGPCDELVELGRDADVLLCEATLERGELDGPLRGHLAPDEATAAAEAAGAKRLLLTHRPRELPLSDSIELAHDGLEVEV
jgi:ribonuclease BN (tRNA processing enzyme)